MDDLELFDGERRVSARIIGFLSSPWSEFCQLKHRGHQAMTGDDLSSIVPSRVLSFLGGHGTVAVEY